ncbi:tyrosine-type recombinase/integrase [Nitrosomonas sp. Is35]|uniref:tyrosine-type recombinase/integrase n=1 Tax=Nitrosomonas sp. Is35 TaxID=3080534 RepID=UPI00294AC38F|nr:integrase arm-type DNA-binding domain-containing protein [Nitrosomonas sp. Is35]MDV6347302.1 tyrosine-type recombinase/integrase [Nitrosomonas sp. Is35]
MAIKEALTDLACKNATVEGGKIRKLHDGQGLYLWVYEDGRKYWRLRYKIHDREKSLSLGVYPVVGLKQARQLAQVERVKLSGNIDPSIDRQINKQKAKEAAANSFEAVAREWSAKQTHTWVKSHAKDVLRRLESNVFPYIGMYPISTIEAPQLLNMIRIIEQRGSYDLAHRVLGVCGQVFRYGVSTSRCTRDPSGDLRGALTPHKKKNQAAVKPEELPELLRAIATYENIGDRQTQLALRLLALTFVRTNELIGALWEEFDLTNALWIVPATRMKMKTEHVVPLTHQALTILTELKTIAGDSRYLLPGRNPNKPISNNTLLFALYRLGYKGKMTGHGFRAVASTALNESGLFNPDAIERQLAHGERNEIRGAYNRAEYLPERKRMMMWWGNHIEALEKGAEVIPLFGKTV